MENRLLRIEDKIDVTPFNNSESTPEQAADNINQGIGLGVEPDQYKEIKPAMQASQPVEVDSRIAERMGKSNEHAKVLNEDVNSWDSLVTHFKYAGEMFDISDEQRKLNKDIWDRDFGLFGEQLTDPNEIEERDFRIASQYEKINEMQSKLRDQYGLEWYESLPETTATAIRSMGIGVFDNADVAGKFMLAGAGAGGLMGLPGGLPGVAGGALVGLKTGATFGIPAAMTVDAFKETASSIYTTALFEGNVNTPEGKQEAKFLALGAATFSSVLEYLQIGKIFKGVPWLKGNMVPKKVIEEASKAANKKSARLLIEVGKKMSRSGLEETAQTFTELLASTAAQDVETDQLSIPDIFDVTVSDPEFAANMAESFITGAAVERTITVGGELVGKATRQRGLPIVEDVDTAEPKAPEVQALEQEQSIVSREQYKAAATSSVRLKVVIDKIADVAKKTKTYELLPDEVTGIVEDLSDQSGLSGVYITKEDLTGWVGTDENRAGMVRGILSDKDVENMDLNAPIFIPFRDAVDMSMRDDSISNLYRHDAEAPSTREWLKENETGFAGFRVKQELNNRTTFGEKDSDSLVVKAKKKAVESVQKTDENVVRVEDLNKQLMAVAQQEETLLNLGKGEDVDLVESYFRNNFAEGELSEQQQKFVKKGRSAFTINPDTLTDVQKKMFKGNKKLKERKIFDKKGMDAKEVAGIMGKSTVDELLLTLSTADNRKEAVGKFKESYDKMENDQKLLTRRAKDLPFLEGYDNLSKAHLDEASKIQKDNDVDFPIPDVSRIIGEAEQIVGATRVSELDPATWKVAESNSQGSAVTKIENGQYGPAVANKVGAARTSQRLKQTYLAIANVNRAFKWIAHSGTKKNQSILKRAGKKYDNSMSFLKTLFKFEDGPMPDGAFESFQKFVQDLKAEKNIDIDIPESVQQWVSEIKRPEDMSVDQLLYATDLMKLVLNEATHLNEFFLKPSENLDEQTRELIKEKMLEELNSNPNYSADNIQDNLVVNNVSNEKLRSLRSSVTNVTHILQNLSQDAGLTSVYRTIADRIQGTGAFKGMGGFLKRTEYNSKFRSTFQKAVEKYGKKKFDNLLFEKVQVPEFADIRSLNNGNVTKMDLLMMAANFGNLENRNRLTNYGLTDNQIFNVLERELTTAEMDFIRDGIWSSLDAVKQDILDLEVETKQSDLKLVKPVAFTFNGKEYQGGYFPIKYKERIDLSKITDNSYSTSLLDNYEGVVASQHTNERTGSDWLVDLSYDNLDIAFTQIAHDLAMRKPVADVMSLLSDKEIATAMQAVMGTDDFLVILDSVREQQRMTQDARLFKTQRKSITSLMKSAESFIYPAYIVWNYSSFLMNSLVIPEMINRKGKVASKYLAQSFGKLTTNYREMYEFASQNDPDLFQEAEGMEVYTERHILSGLVPEPPVIIKGKSRKTLTKLANLRNANNRFWFRKALGSVDNLAKVVNFNASYAQFMAGDAKGYPKSKLDKMNPTQRHNEAVAWSVAINKTTTYTGGKFDKAPIQKLEGVEMFTRFYNDARNVYNNRIRNIKTIKTRSKEMVKHVKDGDHVKAAEAFHDGSSEFAMMLTTIMVSTTMMSLIRGRFPFPEGEEEELKPLDDYTGKEWRSGMDRWLSELMTPQGLAKTVAYDGIAKNIPGIRDLMFALETGQPVSAPLLSVITDATAGATVAYDMFNNPEMANLSLSEAFSEMSRKQKKQLLSTISVMGLKIPVSGPMKIMDILAKMEDSPEDLSYTPMSMNEQLTQYVNEAKGTDRELLANEIEQVMGTINAERPGELTDYDFDVIKYTESGGKWNARNPNSSAFGYYQFIPSTYKEIVESPEGREAGLTMGGLYSSNPEQQEIAMRIHSGIISDSLAYQGVPVSATTVYFGHHFGINATDKYAKKIFNAKDSEPVPKSFLSDNIRKANPWLKNVKTIGQFKKGLGKLLERGQEELENSRR